MNSNSNQEFKLIEMGIEFLDQRPTNTVAPLFQGD
jgi:hypothetical protein